MCPGVAPHPLEVQADALLAGPALGMRLAGVADPRRKLVTQRLELAERQQPRAAGPGLRRDAGHRRAVSKGRYDARGEVAFELGDLPA